jgi:glycosyltransferase involved in cell wall biosynthesis
MLYAKPVVSTSVGQNAEYIINENSALLTRAGDEADFEQALLRLIDDPALRQRLGRNARARLLERFLWSGTSGDNCENAYRSIGLSENLESLSLAS